MAGECVVSRGYSFKVAPDGSIKLTLAALNALGIPIVVVGDKSITLEKLADGLKLTMDYLGEDSVGQAQLAASSVDESAIIDGAVTAVKLGDKAVTADKIDDGAVVTASLGDGAVTVAKLSETLRAMMATLQRKAKGEDWEVNDEWSIVLDNDMGDVPPLAQLYENNAGTIELECDNADKFSIENAKTCGAETIAAFAVDAGQTGRFQNATPATLSLGATGAMKKVAVGCKVAFTGGEIAYIRGIVGDGTATGAVTLQGTIPATKTIEGIYALEVAEGKLQATKANGTAVTESAPLLTETAVKGFNPKNKAVAWQAFDSERELLGEFENDTLGGFNGWKATWKAAYNLFGADAGSVKTVTELRLFNYHDNSKNVENGVNQFCVYATNDDDKWASFADMGIYGWDTISGFSNPHAAVKYNSSGTEASNWQVFAIDNPKPYRYYMVRVLTNHKSGGWYGVRRLAFYDQQTIAASGLWNTAITDASSQIATGGFPTDCETTQSGETISYAFTGDDIAGATRCWSVYVGGAWRKIASNKVADHGGTDTKWYFQNASNAWVACSIDTDEKLCLSEAAAVALNQMAKATLESVDAGWASLTDADTRLNMAIIIRNDDAATMAGVETLSFNAPKYKKVPDASYSLEVVDIKTMMATNTSGATIKLPMAVING